MEDIGRIVFVHKGIPNRAVVGFHQSAKTADPTGIYGIISWLFGFDPKVRRPAISPTTDSAEQRNIEFGYWSSGRWGGGGGRSWGWYGVGSYWGGPPSREK